jgi:hypothetical protein
MYLFIVVQLTEVPNYCYEKGPEWPKLGYIWGQRILTILLKVGVKIDPN